MTVATGRTDAGAQPGAVRAAVARTADVSADSVQTRETHISLLFLTTERAYKLKKPLVLDFLDYGTAARRREMCAEEVRLNARLAPDIYLGLAALCPAEDGLRLAGVDDAAAVDYMVEMRLYDEDQTLAAVVRRGEADDGQVEAVGRRLARFHDECEAAPREHGALAVLDGVQRNLRELTAQLPEPADRDRAFLLGRFMEAFVSARTDELDARARHGRVRDCHGDLRAEHVVLRPQLSIVDCVEFDPGLRTLDVADDLAFLVMDLTRLGAEPLATGLLAAYRAAGGDCADDALIAFFAIHRALVRAKVQFVRAAQHPAASAVRTAAVTKGNAFLALAERFAWRARGPAVMVVCGVPACGKSYLARAVADAAGFPVLSADVVRKELAGLRPRERAPEEVYRPAFNRRTYAELGRRAAAQVNAGSSVLVDATFRRAEDRAAFRESPAGDVPALFIECVVPVAVLSERAAARDRDPARVSDATAEIVERERSAWGPLDEVPAGAHLQLRADRRVQETIGDLAALLDARLGAGRPLGWLQNGDPSSTGVTT